MESVQDNSEFKKNLRHKTFGQLFQNYVSMKHGVLWPGLNYWPLHSSIADLFVACKRLDLMKRVLLPRQFLALSHIKAIDLTGPLYNILNYLRVNFFLFRIWYKIMRFLWYSAESCKNFSAPRTENCINHYFMAGFLTRFSNTEVRFGSQLRDTDFGYWKICNE